MSNPEEVKIVTKTIAVADMTLDELVRLSQGFGHQVEQMRQKRIYINAKIAERLALMERTGDKSRDEGRLRMAGHLAELAQAQAMAAVHGAAPGAVIEVKAEH